MQTEERLKQETESGGLGSDRGSRCCRRHNLDPLDVLQETDLGQSQQLMLPVKFLWSKSGGQNFRDHKKKKNERKAWNSICRELPIKRLDWWLGCRGIWWFGSRAVETNQIITDERQSLVYVNLLRKCVSRLYFCCNFLQTCSTQRMPLWASSSSSEKSSHKVCSTGKYVCPKAHPCHRTSYYK